MFEPTQPAHQTAHKCCAAQ